MYITEMLKKAFSMKSYIVWSHEKLSGYSGRDGSLDDLVRYENDPIGGGLSSLVETHHIKQFIEACYNETDIKLSYCLVEEYEAKEKELGIR